MTTRYRVEYALKSHRRDQFIEWIKGLLAVPFVLCSRPTTVYEKQEGNVAQMAEEAHRRYAEVMKDIEDLINDHSSAHLSKLKHLVPSVGTFFTQLPLELAFKYQDRKRYISSRRFVPPSFNDVRLVLNTAQVMGAAMGGLDLATFDGDVTLYDDGQSLEPSNPVIPRIIQLMKHDTKIGIVTAAGYTEAEKYYGRLHGLLDAVKTSTDLTDKQRGNLVVMGGESNFLFVFDLRASHLLRRISRKEWILQAMHDWTEPAIQALLDKAEGALRECVAAMRLDALVLRKERAVGIIPATPGAKFARESLEETVLVVQKILDTSEEGKRIPFCAFNGGNDVFVDIGDKRWGVMVCQKYFGCMDAGQEPIPGAKTLHVGDQFLSAGANDFKARVVGTTAWIASPAETVELLDQVLELAFGDGKPRLENGV